MRRRWRYHHRWRHLCTTLLATELHILYEYAYMSLVYAHQIFSDSDL